MAKSCCKFKSRDHIVMCPPPRKSLVEDKGFIYLGIQANKITETRDMVIAL